MAFQTSPHRTDYYFLQFTRRWFSKPTMPPVSTPPILTVSQLTEGIKDAVESIFPAVWVSGEISNFTRATSGHLYFTLKDEGAQLKACMWRASAARLRFQPHDGLEVVCQGAIEVYPPRGQYQFILQQMEPKGEGALQLALRQLRERLAKEGLFSQERKRPLPPFPKRIAFVTSPTGAAVRDFLEVARRRWAGASVLVIPAKVQGNGAAAEIVAGIQAAARLRPAPEVLVVGRGGGSLEDLWSFNEEAVVRAIYASPIPVVSAVGHEIDVTLADLVADVRALTPSEAAERVIPSSEELTGRIGRLTRHLASGVRNRIARAKVKLQSLADSRPLRRPFDLVHDLARMLDELDARGRRAVLGRLRSGHESLARLAGSLDSLSPLGVLSRGYSITQRAGDRAVIRSIHEVAPGETILTRIQNGEVISRIEEVRPNAAAAEEGST